MTSTDRILCYNKGCGLAFDPLTAKDDACLHHPGVPVFHDAYKGWSCCNKKSTDFTTFLNMKGCLQGKHNGEKPQEQKQRKPDYLRTDEVIVVRPPIQASSIRPNIETKMSHLKVVISLSLKTALENVINECNAESKTENENGLRIGFPCQNNSCTSSYEGEESNIELCLHHPGSPVFHEGLKFWTCCNKRTSDFDVFLNQKGCITGSHLWIQKTVKKAACRYDWHQTASYIYITVYAKLPQPKFSHVRANPIKLESEIVFGEDNIFKLEEELGGVIQVEQSEVTMAATKVEVKLKKADCKSWQKLFLVSKFVKQGTEDDEINKQQDLAIDLKDVDLNDI